MRAARLRLVALTAGLVTACSTSYVPRRSGSRISVVMDGGQIAYDRDGHIYSHGFLGGGLVDAVRGVRPAEEAARTFRVRMGGGLLLLVGGLVCSFVALGVAFERSADDESARPLAVSGACLVTGLVGGGVMASGAPYQWDAINLYNDAVSAPPPANAAPPGATPPSPP